MNNAIVTTVEELELLRADTILKAKDGTFYLVTTTARIDAPSRLAHRHFERFGMTLEVAAAKIPLPATIISEPKKNAKKISTETHDVYVIPYTKGFEELSSELEQMCDDSDSVQYGTLGTSYVRDYLRKLHATHIRETRDKKVTVEEIEAVIADRYNYWMHNEKNRMQFIEEAADDILVRIPQSLEVNVDEEIVSILRDLISEEDECNYDSPLMCGVHHWMIEDEEDKCPFEKANILLNKIDSQKEKN